MTSKERCKEYRDILRIQNICTRCRKNECLKHTVCDECLRYIKNWQKGKR